MLRVIFFRDQGDIGIVDALEISLVEEKFITKLIDIVAEPPELSGPHAPIIVSKTSDRRARVPNDSRSLSCVLGKPESSTLHSFQEFPH